MACVAPAHAGGDSPQKHDAGCKLCPIGSDSKLYARAISPTPEARPERADLKCQGVGVKSASATQHAGQAIGGGGGDGLTPVRPPARTVKTATLNCQPQFALGALVTTWRF